MCSVVTRSIFSAGRFLYKSTRVFAYDVNSLPRIKSNNSYSTDNKFNNLSNDENQQEDNEHNLAAGVRPEYQVFRDEDAEIIFDVDEEQKKLDLKTINALEHTVDPYQGLNMKHGIKGVFDIEDLVEILRKDKVQNIFVATVPPELSYVDYIVLVNGKSQRHMSALATYIRKAYKLKRYPNEILPKIEGEKSKDWIAIDLGNIALHIFSSEARHKYDLETLWSVGSKYDKVINGNDYDTEFQDRYSEYLAGFQPADEIEKNS